MLKKGTDKTFSPNVNLWLGVKKDIEAKIIAGEYEQGGKIPTIVELGEQYNIGKTTAQKVINSLCDEGTIVKRVGIGCFVKPLVRGKLLEKHTKELEQHINGAIEEAFLLGFDREHVRKLIDDMWVSFSKQ